MMLEAQTLPSFQSSFQVSGGGEQRISAVTYFKPTKMDEHILATFKQDKSGLELLFQASLELEGKDFYSRIQKNNASNREHINVSDSYSDSKEDGISNSMKRRFSLPSSERRDRRHRLFIKARRASDSDIFNASNSQFINNKKICKFCQKIFPTKSRLLRHALIHTGEKPFECLSSKCTKRFNRRDNMMQHYRTCCTVKEKDSSSGSDDIY